MVKKTIWLWLAGLALACSGVAHAQLNAKGLIIRVVDQLVYIDLGRRDGVQPGDLYDIVTADVLADPLSGDTLAVSPVSVGAIRVVQVFDKMSIAELLHMQEGGDPMLMKIAPIDSSDRLVEIEQFLQSSSFNSAGPSRLQALVPGIYQIKNGNKRKGGALMLAETASLVAGLSLRLSSNDWKERYDAYEGSDDDYWDELGKGMQSRRRWSNRFFWVAGALYAYNWIDALWMRGGPPLETQARIAERSPVLVLGVDATGRPLLQVVDWF